MKKFLISIMFVLVSITAFAGERKFDARGNLSSVEENEMNGAFYSATLHFTSKETLYLAGFTEDKMFFYITDGIEAFLIPNSKITQVYWKYPVEVSELCTLIDEDCEYVISLLYELHDGTSYIAHTEYTIYDNYIRALERGEDAKFIGPIEVAHK